MTLARFTRPTPALCILATALAIGLPAHAQDAAPTEPTETPTEAPTEAPTDAAEPTQAAEAAPAAEMPTPIAGDATAGAAKAAVCVGCHGMDGKALQPQYPNIAGQHSSYLAKQLTNYREGERVNAIMNGIAATLTDEDIQNLAAYYAEQPMIEGVADPELVTLGESIYRGGITSEGIPACIGCHNPQGLGNPASVVPVLSGQNQQYTADQLRYFREGIRANDPNQVMRSLAHRLVDVEIDSVASYIAGLH